MGSEKIVITSALPYANGEIHLGHVVSTYLPADIYARFCRMKGYDVVFTCATDDYGTPILIRAEQEGKTPREYVEYWNKRDLEDFTKLGITFDIFYKTSSEENLKLTQYFFLRLYEKGYIYSAEVEQPYCKNDKKFLPDRYVVGRCPYCGAENQYSDGCEVCGRTFAAGEIKEPKCILCGTPPTTKRSVHYFFRLSQFSERLKAWLEGNTNLQTEVKNYVLRWIETGLKDWDITRDISWGVPIPLKEAEGKVLYGWFDNHLCYISTTIKYLEEKGIDGKKFWNSAKILHFIGKDIVYHHYLFLPAMRMGLDEEYALPYAIPTRGHLLLQGQKFSKSRGWYVSLREFLEYFPADYLRYYLASITPYSQADVNFDWREFAAKINNELVANIGNFVYRVLSFIYSRFEATVPQPKEPDELDTELIDRIKSTTVNVGSHIEKNELDRGLKSIVELSAFCNQYFQRKEPWKQSEKAANCLYYSVNATRSLAILLHPYIPYSTEELWRQLSLGGKLDLQSWDSAKELLIKGNHKISKPRVLFRKIAEEELKPWLERLKK
ncbi:MAG: methionine--tRNA ligase [Nitrososphaerales archaeon]